MRTNTPEMNITNQINAGLNDVRKTLIELSNVTTVANDESLRAIAKAQYEFDMIVTMIQAHKCGNSQPWSDRKPMVDEEFS